MQYYPVSERGKTHTDFYRASCVFAIDCHGLEFQDRWQIRRVVKINDARTDNSTAEKLKK